MMCAVHSGVIGGAGGVKHVANRTFAGSDVGLAGVDVKLDEFATF